VHTPDAAFVGRRRELDALAGRPPAPRVRVRGTGRLATDELAWRRGAWISLLPVSALT
jgi:hypothetical protein